MYQTTRLTPEAYTDLVNLYRICFGKTISFSSVSAKFDTSYLGVANFGFLARDTNNEVGAYYGVFPMVLCYDGIDFLVAQSGDTMTAPKHQKKGLFVRLASETYKLADEKGVKLVFGFPNENSFPGFKNKLNWVFAGNMQKFAFQTSALPFCELISRFDFLAPLYNRFVSLRLKNLQAKTQLLDFKKFNFCNNRGLIKKDEKFFKYKLKQPNNYLIEINGFTILLKIETHLVVGDIAFFDESETQALVETLKKLAKKLLCKQIILTVSKNHWLYDRMSKFSSPQDSLPIGFRLFTETFELQTIQFVGADFDTF